ncbi:MAG: phosphoglucosamine mutase [Candidatus Omnitrophica bacterium]|nr:phosphoglucosamine mutase [Candidatus Omnitrophota bacterium]
MEKSKLFGTDGIRGEFGEWPLTEEVVYNVSLAISAWLRKKHKNKIKVVIGKDTRRSCSKIEQIFANGFKRAGGKVYSAGVIPTPGLAYLANTMDAELGVMISASHNPWRDNGIKFFKHNGFKLSEKEERAIERIAFPLLFDNKVKPKINKITLQKTSGQVYIEHLKKCVFDLDLSGKRIVADCANGAVSAYARILFESLGAKVFLINNKPDGVNINRNCGSLHPQGMADLVKMKKADIGFSFDGDGDRVLFSDEKGKILDGDFIMSLIAMHFMRRKCLLNNTVVATSMSNFGLEKFLEAINVRLIRADVGDKYVLEELIKNKASFGGEQSGHIIFLEHATTGDGMLSALKILQAMQREKKKISVLAAGLKKYPQLIKNVRVTQRKDFKKMPAVWKKITEAQNKLKNNGRLVMRYSGTEPLARIMVEGQNKREIKMIADSIAQSIENELGESK